MTETGLDYFGARYFSGAQGRFTSPDQALVGQTAGDPQSWNLYAYGLNKPLRYTASTGHVPQQMMISGHFRQQSGTRRQTALVTRNAPPGIKDGLTRN